MDPRQGHDTFCPIGPWIVTDVDPADLELRTEVNGQAQTGQPNVALMIHDIGDDHRVDLGGDDTASR